MNLMFLDFSKYLYRFKNMMTHNFLIKSSFLKTMALKFRIANIHNIVDITCCRVVMKASLVEALYDFFRIWFISSH